MYPMVGTCEIQNQNYSKARHNMGFDVVNGITGPIAE